MNRILEALACVWTALAFLAFVVAALEPTWRKKR